MKYLSRSAFVFSSLLLPALVCLPLMAQTATATVEGTVKDPTGAVVPGVEITLTHQGTGAQRFAVSDDAGRFRMSGVPFGPYHAEAALTGFKTATADFDLDVAARQTLNFVLEIGEITEVVETIGSVQRVNTQEGAMSSVVQEKQVADLPLNGRNVFRLALLQPGITEGRTDGIGGQSGINASGNRTRGNNFSIDGVTNNDPITGGATALTPNLDTIAEFRIQNNNFSAEYGRNNGAVINVVSKSGSNEFHGTAFWYHRNDALDARETFDAEDIAPLRQHQAGFTIGGPVVPDKTFFYFGFEAERVFSGESSSSRVETPEFRALVSSMFPGTTSDFFFSTYPAPTPTRDFVDAGSISGQFVSAGPADGINDTGLVDAFFADLFKSYQYNVRIDHEVTENNKLFGRYIWEPDESPPAALRGDDMGSFFDGFNAQGVISDTHIFSPTLVNELRFGYARDSSDFVQSRLDIADFNIFNWNGGDGILGFGAYGGLPQFFTGEEYHLVDVLSINRGDHGIKVGFEYRWNQDDSDFAFLTKGYIGYAGIMDFAANLPYEVSARVDPRQVGGVPDLVGTPHNFRQSELGFFVQDDWKVTDRLTLNLGLRYDNYGEINDTQGRLANLILGPGADVFERVANGVVGAVEPSGIFARDNNNFAPRFGFAWDMFGDGKTSMRGGFGVAYDRLFLNVSGNVRFNPPFSANLGLYPLRQAGLLGITSQEMSLLISSGAVVPFRVPGGVTSAGFNPGGGPLLDVTVGASTVQLGGRISLRAPDPSMRSSYSMNWFYGFQRELPWDMIFEVNYAGNVGRKLGFIEQYNRFPGDRFGLPNQFGVGAGSTGAERLNPWFTSENLRTNNVNSVYHGGNVSVQKRFSRGLAFQSAFTFGKVLDVGSDNFGSNSGSIFTPNPDRLDLEKGLAGFDIPKRWVSNFIWEIPFMREQEGFAGQVFGGWQLQSIITLQDGTPYTPQAFSGTHDYNGDFRSNDRPDAPANTSQYNGLSRQQYRDGVFGGAGATARAVFNPNGLPGDIDGDGRRGPGIGIGTMGRSMFRGPGYNDIDFSLFKHFRVPWFGQEDARIQFRAEFFNFFNRTNFNQVQRSFTSGSFGKVTSAQDAREIQFALKLIF